VHVQRYDAADGAVTDTVEFAAADNEAVPFSLTDAAAGGIVTTDVISDCITGMDTRVVFTTMEEAGSS
jgi:hypothetical protein